MASMLSADGDTKFTPRQRQVVHLIAEGYSNLEIAERLGISPRTAKAHCDILRVKLGVSRRRHVPAAFRQTTGEDPHTLKDLDAGVGARLPT